MQPIKRLFPLTDNQFEYKGIQWGKLTSIELLERVQKLQFRNTDVVVTTFPKCGTTVTEEIVWHIRNKDKIEKDVQYGDLNIRIPFIEVDSKARKPDYPLSIEAVENDKSDKRLIMTHCPLKLFNNPDGSNNLYDPKRGSDNPKTIVVARNPLDTIISFYHFYQSNPGIRWQGKVEEFYEMFMQGMNIYGSFTDWYLDYCKILKKKVVRLNICYSSNLKT